MKLLELMESLNLEVVRNSLDEDREYYDVCRYSGDEELYRNILYISCLPVHGKKGITFLYPAELAGEKLDEPCICVKGPVMRTFHVLHQFFTRQNQSMYQIQPFINYLVSQSEHNIQSIIDHFAEVLNNPIILTNSVYKVLAINNKGLSDIDPIFDTALKTGYCDADAIRSFESEGVTQKVLSTANAILLTEGLAEKVPRILGKVVIGKETVAYIGILEKCRKFDSGDLNTAELLCEILQHEFEHDEALLYKTNIIYESIIQDILNGTLTSPLVLRDRISVSRWVPRTHFRCVLMTTQYHNQTVSNMTFLINTIRRGLNIKVIRYGNEILALANYSSLEEYENQIRGIAEEAEIFNLKVGVSEEFDDLLELPETYHQASSVIRIATALHAKDTVFKFSAFLPFYLISNIDAAVLRSCTNTYYMKLRQYDQKHGTDSVDTLYYYILYNCSINETAAKMNVHRNTLRYRLEKITELTGIDLSYGIDLQNYVLYHQIQRYLSCCTEPAS